MSLGWKNEAIRMRLAIWIWGSFLFMSHLSAQKISGIFMPTEAEMAYTTVEGWSNFLADHDAKSTQGLRLIDLESSRVGGDQRVYYGIYTESGLRDTVAMALGWRDFVKLKRTMNTAGYTMDDVHAFALNERDFQYIGVWVKEETPHKIARLTSRAGIEEQVREMGARRYKLKRLHVINTPDGEPEYVALFHYSAVQEYNFLYYTKDLADFRKDLEERRLSDIRLVDYASFTENGERFYLGVYQRGTYDYAFERHDEQQNLEEVAQKLKKERGLSLMNRNVY